MPGDLCFPSPSNLNCEGLLKRFCAVAASLAKVETTEKQPAETPQIPKFSEGVLLRWPDTLA